MSWMVPALQSGGRCPPYRVRHVKSILDGGQAVGQSVKIVEPRDAPESVLHDGRQINPIYGADRRPAIAGQFAAMPSLPPTPGRGRPTSPDLPH